jgi:hypothetical protein
MIKVNRVDCPAVLRTGVVPITKGQEETQRNIGRSEKTFKVYADKTVRKALQKMFNGKCAYCESRITAIYSGDIEHFRPKGGRYYWLAADWENLLFACPFCNQTHTHTITVDGSVIEVVQGKRDQFPLLSEEYRLDEQHALLFFSDEKAYKAAYTQEESLRLLLKPCTDENIEQCFKYNNQGVILVEEGLNTSDRKRAETSIQVYALQRLGLVQEREAKVIQVKAQIRRVEKAIYTFNQYYDRPLIERTWLEGVLRREMQILQQFTYPDQEYAGLARYFIRKYFKTLNIIQNS